MNKTREKIEELGNQILELARQRNELIEQEARDTGKVHSVTNVLIADPNGPFRQAFGGMIDNNELIAAALLCYQCNVNMVQLEKIVQILRTINP